MLTRRHALGLGTAALAAPALRLARAQPAWPNQPVRMVVPFAAGGPTDVPARLIADEMSKALPHRIVVENRTGSGVVVGTDMVAKGPQDGSMLLYTTVAHSVLRPMFPRLPFDPVADFTPVALVGQVPVILLVNKDFPARNLREFIEVLRANPGKYDYASSGNGGAVHLATELFMHAAGGLKVNHVPFRGSSAAMPEVLSGRIPMIFDVAAGALPYVRSGELRALGISTGARSPLAPDLPTIAEQGVPGYEAYTWHMVMVRAGTPEPVVQAINRAVNEAVRPPHIQEKLKEMTMQTVTDSTPASAAAYLRSEMAKWEPIVQEAGIRAN